MAKHLRKNKINPYAEQIDSMINKINTHLLPLQMALYLHWLFLEKAPNYFASIRQ